MSELHELKPQVSLDLALERLYSTLKARGLLGADPQITHDYVGVCAEVALLRGSAAEYEYWAARQAKLKRRLPAELTQAA